MKQVNTNQGSFSPIDKIAFLSLIDEFRKIQSDFFKFFGVNDIFSNSKIYEIIIANELDHNLIPGHSGSKDAKNDSGGEYEYKHFKETSSNHSWTFNDYSDQTIESLSHVESVIFAHILDTKYPPLLDWYIEVPGKLCASYLKERTEDLLSRKPKGHQNNRRMINFSEKQLTSDLGIGRTVLKPINIGKKTKYGEWLTKIYEINSSLEECTHVKNILTSNKMWEVLVAIELGHDVNSEQGGRDGAHDAYDSEGNLYEYKVSKTNHWTFQDISENVLVKYLLDKSIILAVVDKTNINVVSIYSANPSDVVLILRDKLKEKEKRYLDRGKKVPRLEVSIGLNDLKKINITKIL